MSRDDYVGIVKVGKKFKGYHLSASESFPTIKDLKMREKPIFASDSLVDAILDAQEIDSEYGYSFLNLKRVIK